MYDGTLPVLRERVYHVVESGRELIRISAHRREDESLGKKMTKQGNFRFSSTSMGDFPEMHLFEGLA